MYLGVERRRGVAALTEPNLRSLVIPSAQLSSIEAIHSSERGSTS